MKRMKFAASLVLLAACSGASSLTTSDQDAGDVPDAATSDGNAGTTHDAAQHDGSTWTSDTGAVDATMVDGSTFDAGSDAGRDAGPDASFDAGTDAGDQTDSSFDGGPEASFDGSFTCKNGATRCQDYQLQTCNPVGGMPNTWVWDMGRQDCCHDPRFTVNGANVDDSKTGLSWYRFIGMTSCSALGAYRFPTTAELLGLLIGTPVNNKPVCDGPLDQIAFPGGAGENGDLETADGCVDMLHGVSDPTCLARPLDGWLCVAK